MATDWALVVGVSAYPGLSGADRALPGAVADAQEFASWLGSPRGGAIDDPARVRLVLTHGQPTTPIGASPARHEIEQFFDEIEQQPTPDGRVGRRLWIYVVGHGGDLGVAGRHETVLLTAEATDSRGYHFATRLWAWWVRGEAYFDEVIVVADCCRTVLPPMPLAAPTRRDVVAPAPPPLFAYLRPVPVGRQAWERTDASGKARGVFTSKLLEGLRGSAADEHEQVTLQNLADWLEAQLPGCSIEIEPRRGDAVLASPGRTGDLLPAPAASPVLPDVTVRSVEEHEDLEQIAGALRDRGLSVAIDVMNGRRAARPPGRLLVMPLYDRDPEPPSIPTGFDGKLVTIDFGDVGRRPLAAPARELRASATYLDELAASIRDLIERPSLEVRAPLGVHLELIAPNGSVTTGWSVVAPGSTPTGVWKVRASVGRLEQATRFAYDGNAASMFVPGPDLKAPEWRLDGAPGALCIEARAGAPLVGWSLLDAAGDRLLDLTEAPVGGWICVRRDQLPRQVQLAFLPAARERRRYLPLQLHPDMVTRVWLEHPDTDPASAIAEAVIVVGDQGDAELAAVRERLRIHVRDQSELPPEVWTALAAALAADPIGSLLVAPLSEAALACAEAVWGADDPDVRALGGGQIDLRQTPRTLAAWQAILARAGGAELAPAAGRRAAPGPWLIRHDGNPTYATEAIANVLWPGWNVVPRKHARTLELEPKELAPPPSSPDVTLAALVTDLPVSWLKEPGPKRPPVGRLIRHDEIAFVGATNDQLAAALAAAFQLRRDRGRWKRLELFFLSDEPLGRIRSGGRPGAELPAVRDAAEAHLAWMLPHVAERWTMYRYDEPWIFASFWDLGQPNAFAHLSPYLWGQDLRTTIPIDLDGDAHRGALDLLARSLGELRNGAQITHSREP